MDAPEELVRDEQFADRATLRRLEDMRFSVPRPQRVLVQHLEEPAQHAHRISNRLRAGCGLAVRRGRD